MPYRHLIELDREETPRASLAFHDPDRPLRVVHVMTSLVLAGMEYGVIKVSNRILARGVLPAIVCLRYESADARAALDAAVRVVALDENPSRNWSLIPKLARVFRSLGAEIVHTHNWQTYVYGVLAARLAGVPVVIHGEHGHDTTQRSQRRRLAQRALIPLVDRFVAVSEDLGRELTAEWRLRPEDVQLIANGVDTELFHPGRSADALRRELGYSGEARVVSIVGGLRPIKGHATLLEAFARILPNVPQARLLIVGSDFRRGHRQELAALATELGVRDAVRFEDTRSDIVDVLALSDVYVNSSLFEGMSNTILEAMAAGKAVVATAVGGNVELVQDGRTGILVPSEDPAALAAGLQSVLTDGALRERLGASARAYVERMHPMSRMVRRYADLYEEAWTRRAWRRRAPFRERAKRLLARAVVLSGAAAMGRVARGRALTILTYHRVLPLHDALRYPFPGMVLPADTFEHQVAHLARRYRVLPFEEALRRLYDGSLPERAVAITFDDGYRDNHDRAMPILKRHGVPATFFVVTDAIEARTMLWWDEVAAIDPVEAPRLVRRLNAAGRAEREGWIRSARAERGSGPEDRAGLMMTWDHVASLLREGMTVGSHTRTHAFLDELSEPEIREEITGSLRALRDRAGVASSWLAFPRGRVLRHHGGQSLLESLGLTAAVTTESGINGRDADPFGLMRIDAGYARLHTTFHAAQFDVELAALRPRLGRD